ncbi:hypothetical protein [Methanosarcina sp.]|nr:hypothetical protein [Methanosarcina sp.]HOW15176.1 hypothetical protein [Methanosarcina sp.]
MCGEWNAIMVILSMDHTIEGFVDVNSIRTDITGCRGYIEKDWGVSMPSS